MAPEELIALDAHIAAQAEPKPTRPEAIRRVLADGLPARVQSAPCPERASTARKHAGAAADAEMREVEAPADEKTRRRKALTDEPTAVAKARSKRGP